MFPVVIFASLAFTKIIPLPFLPRYDWLLIICLLMQWWMVRSGLETRDELKVITLFHLIGLALEIFKVHIGSWSYPEEGYLKIFGVPLYSGFMYLVHLGKVSSWILLVIVSFLIVATLKQVKGKSSTNRDASQLYNC